MKERKKENTKLNERKKLAGHPGPVGSCTLTLDDVIDPNKIIKKLYLQPKLLPSDNSIIGVTLNWSYIQFIFDKNKLSILK